jgi:hypothetical protein
MEVGGQLHSSAASLSGKKKPRYPLCRGMGEPQSRSRPYGEEKNALPLPGIETRFLVVQSVAESLYRLGSPG